LGFLVSFRAKQAGLVLSFYIPVVDFGHVKGGNRLQLRFGGVLLSIQILRRRRYPPTCIRTRSSKGRLVVFTKTTSWARAVLGKFFW